MTTPLGVPPPPSTDAMAIPANAATPTFESDLIPACIFEPSDLENAPPASAPAAPAAAVPLLSSFLRSLEKPVVIAFTITKAVASDADTQATAPAPAAGRA